MPIHIQKARWESIRNKIIVMGKSEKKEAVLRLVEAQIAGCVDLSPEEMVDAAVIMVERIDEMLNVGGVIEGSEVPPELQLRCKHGKEGRTV